MSKKQLISSLAITGVIITSIPSNVFAYSDDNKTPSNNIITSDNDSISSSIDISGFIMPSNPENNTSKIVTNQNKETKGYETGTFEASNAPYLTTQNSTLKCSMGSHKYTPEKIPCNAIVDTDTVMIMKVPGNPPKLDDSFKVNVNKVGGDKNTDVYAGYKVIAQVSDDRIDFTVITESGASLGNLENGQSILDSKKIYTDGITEYKFHYPFLNYGERIININIKPIKGKKVSTSDELINALKENKKQTIELTDNITLTDDDINKLGKTPELTIKNSVSIRGNNHWIDLNNKASITLKGNNMNLSDLTIVNGKNLGLHIYNCRNVYLKNVTVQNTNGNNSKSGGTSGFGIYINGSSVDLDSCTTKNNASGGIYISRSLELRTSNCIDSNVVVINKLTQEENNGKPQVLRKDFEMIVDGKTRMQGNSFLPISETYEHTNIAIEYKPLSKTYCDILDVPTNRKFRSQTIKYYDASNKQPTEQQTPCK